MQKIIRGIIGAVFIVLGSAAIIMRLNEGNVDGVLWFSYFALLIVGIGILKRDSFLIVSQINIILIPYIFWNIDFFYTLITGNNLWGITSYFFMSENIFGRIISIQHVFIVPAGLLAIYLIGLKRRDSWKISLIQVGIIFLLVRIFTNPNSNINCAFSNCLPFYVSSMYYPILWLLGYVIIIFVTNYLIVKIFKNKS